MNGTVVSLLQNDRTDEIWKQGEEYPVLYYAADSGKKEQVATPTFSFDGDSLVISCATEDALIWYQSAVIDSTFVDEWAQYTAPMFVAISRLMPRQQSRECLTQRLHQWFITIPHGRSLLRLHTCAI